MCSDDDGARIERLVLAHPDEAFLRAADLLPEARAPWRGRLADVLSRRYWPPEWAYVRTPEPYDKAGAYAIQGHAALWCAGIEGCYYNIMGLPVHRTAQLLRAPSALRVVRRSTGWPCSSLVARARQASVNSA